MRGHIVGCAQSCRNRGSHSGLRQRHVPNREEHIHMQVCRTSIVELALCDRTNTELTPVVWPRDMEIRA